MPDTESGLQEAAGVVTMAADLRRMADYAKELQTDNANLANRLDHQQGETQRLLTAVAVAVEYIDEGDMNRAEEVLRNV